MRAILPILLSLLLGAPGWGAGGEGKGPAQAPAPSEAPAPAASEGGPAPESASCVDATLSAVQRRYEAIRDLAADFEQTTRSVALGSASSGQTASRGTVVFAKPGKMRWSYEAPERSVVVSDGETLWLYDPDHAEVQVFPVGQAYLTGAAIQFLLGEGDIAGEFQVKELACDAETAELELVPRNPATYEKLRIVVRRPSGDLLRTTVIDLLGNVTEVSFHDVRVNQDPDEGVFRFEVPAGASVIEVEVPRVEERP